MRPNAPADVWKFIERVIASTGLAHTKIAPLYGVCTETIRRIVVGKTY